MEGQNDLNPEVPNSENSLPQPIGEGDFNKPADKQFSVGTAASPSKVTQRKRRRGQQNDDRARNDEQNGTPTQASRHGQKQDESPDFLTVCSDFSRWTGSLAFGGIMAILSGLLGNAPRKNATVLLDCCVVSLFAAFIFAIFLLVISSIRPKIPNLQTVANITLPLQAACLVVSVMLATSYLMK